MPHNRVPKQVINCRLTIENNIFPVITGTDGLAQDVVRIEAQDPVKRLFMYVPQGKWENQSLDGEMEYSSRMQKGQEPANGGWLYLSLIHI